MSEYGVAWLVIFNCIGGLVLGFWTISRWYHIADKVRAKRSGNRCQYLYKGEWRNMRFLGTSGEQLKYGYNTDEAYIIIKFVPPAWQ